MAPSPSEMHDSFTAGPLHRWVRTACRLQFKTSYWDLLGYFQGISTSRGVLGLPLPPKTVARNSDQNAQNWTSNPRYREFTLYTKQRRERWLRTLVWTPLQVVYTLHASKICHIKLADNFFRLSPSIPAPDIYKAKASRGAWERCTRRRINREYVRTSKVWIRRSVLCPNHAPKLLLSDQDSAIVAGILEYCRILQNGNTKLLIRKIYGDP